MQIFKIKNQYYLAVNAFDGNKKCSTNPFVTYPFNKIQKCNAEKPIKVEIVSCDTSNLKETDISVKISSKEDNLKVGQEVTLQIDVKNNGPKILKQIHNLVTFDSNYLEYLPEKTKYNKNLRIEYDDENALKVTNIEDVELNIDYSYFPVFKIRTSANNKTLNVTTIISQNTNIDDKNQTNNVDEVYFDVIGLEEVEINAIQSPNYCKQSNWIDSICGGTARGCKAGFRKQVKKCSKSCGEGQCTEQKRCVEDISCLN